MTPGGGADGRCGGFIRLLLRILGCVVLLRLIAIAFLLLSWTCGISILFLLLVIIVLMYGLAQGF